MRLPWRSRRGSQPKSRLIDELQSKGLGRRLGLCPRIANTAAELFPIARGANSPNERAQVSNEEGIEPRWSRSGKELFFRSKSRVLSVKFGPGNGLNPSKPVTLFEDTKEWAGYDVAPDERLLVARAAENKGVGTTINVVLNWFEELKRKQRN